MLLSFSGKFFRHDFRFHTLFSYQNRVVLPTFDKDQKIGKMQEIT